MRTPGTSLLIQYADVGNTWLKLVHKIHESISMGDTVIRQRMCILGIGINKNTIDKSSGMTLSISLCTTSMEI